MENASKALIIAGAILLSILIIGLGMMIFNQAKDAIGNTGMDQQKITTYNAEFEAYVGPNVSGTRVRSLCDLVRNHNITYQDDESMIVSINGSSEGLSAYKNTIKAGKTYSVTITDEDGYDSKTGYVKNITIEESK